MSTGYEFEDALVSCLRGMGHEVEACEDLDKRRKIDGVIRTLARRQPARYPVEFQLTLRCDRRLKLERYLATRDYQASAVHLYAEIMPGIGARHAAQMLSKVAAHVQGRRPYGEARCFGVRLALSWHVYDPYVRLIELRARESDPAYLAKFVEGRIVSFRLGGFWIGAGDRKYQALFADVGDDGDRAALRRVGESDLSLPLRVRFLPDRGYAADVRVIDPSQLDLFRTRHR
jgi:hypothetical protein